MRRLTTLVALVLLLAGAVPVLACVTGGVLSHVESDDEYQLYFRPVVLGHGKLFFAGPRPPLRLVASDRLGEDTIRLTYVPA